MTSPSPSINTFPDSNNNSSFDSFPQNIQSIIAMLRVTIDQLDSDIKKARELILEIARQLDEGKLCERGRISIKIKEILEDKIRAGKITERWISKCLPQEYKREYAKDKRELGSLSKKKPIPVSGTVSAMQKEQDNEQVVLATEPQLKHEVAVRASGQEEVVEPTYSPGDGALRTENSELKEALSRQITFIKADEVSLHEIEFKIPKEKGPNLGEAIQKCRGLVYVVFDKSGMLEHAIPDIFREE